MAQSGVSLRCQWLTAIGGEADIARATRTCRSGAIDPKWTLGNRNSAMQRDGQIPIQNDSGLPKGLADLSVAG
jgi:hypothetical protein